MPQTESGSRKRSGTGRGAFTKQLREAIKKRGWGPTEAARQANVYLGSGQEIAPASISHYCSGRAFPRPRQLSAIVKALGLNPEEFGMSGVESEPAITRPSEREQKSPKLQIEDEGNGGVRIRIDQTFSWPIAVRILDLLKSEIEADEKLQKPERKRG